MSYRTAPPPAPELAFDPFPAAEAPPPMPPELVHELARADARIAELARRGRPSLPADVQELLNQARQVGLG